MHLPTPVQYIGFLSPTNDAMRAMLLLVSSLIEVHDFIAQARDKVDGLAAELREPLKVWPRDRHEVHPQAARLPTSRHFQRQAVLPCLYVFLHIAA